MVIDLIDYSIDLSYQGEQLVTFIFMLVGAYGVRAIVRDFRKWLRRGMPVRKAPN